jgi:hypothetical protein
VPGREAAPGFFMPALNRLAMEKTRRVLVAHLPHPLIPVDAGIQTLPNCRDLQWAKASRQLHPK